MPNDQLWNSIIDGSFAKGIKKATAIKRSHKRGSTDAARAVLNELGLIARSLKKSPWRPVAIVLPLIHTTCRCGSVHTQASSTPLVRFLHKNGSIEETANHPSRFNANLPHLYRDIYTSSEYCTSCFTAVSERPPSPYRNAQMDLFTIFDAHRPFSHPLAIAVDSTNAVVPKPGRIQREYIASDKCNNCRKFLPISAVSEQPTENI